MSAISLAMADYGWKSLWWMMTETLKSKGARLYKYWNQATEGRNQVAF